MKAGRGRTGREMRCRMIPVAARKRGAVAYAPRGDRPVNYVIMLSYFDNSALRTSRIVHALRHCARSVACPVTRVMQGKPAPVPAGI